MKSYARVLCSWFLINSHLMTPIASHSSKRLQIFMKRPKNNFSPMYKPKTLNQEEYVTYLNNPDTKIVISVGPAGCGKTLFACQKAIMQLKSEEIDRIIITRPVVSVDEEIGFLPGDIIKKMDPWTKPIFDIFLEHYRKPELDLMLMKGKIEICPLAFMRGRTFKQAFIIADEMQNSSPNQMKMLTTRLGENSRMVITGDLQQTDILKENGLRDFVGRLDRFKNVTDIIKLVKLEADDIERSDVVRKVIDIYDDAPVVNKPNPVKTYSFDTTIYTNNNNKETGDAALIPIQHMTRNSLNKTILNTKNNTKTE